MARVLVIDDEPLVRGLVRSMLKRAGHDAVEAIDGDEGLHAAAAGGFDLVVCDLFMPGKDGIETIRELHERFPDLPIIAVSGGAFGGALDLLGPAQVLGARLALRKPFTYQELLDAVARALGG